MENDLSPLERVSSIFQNNQPDKIVRGNIGLNPEVIKRILGKEFDEGDLLKSQILACEKIGLDIIIPIEFHWLEPNILSMILEKKEGKGRRYLGRYGVIDGRHIFRNANDGNFYEIRKSGKIRKFISKSIDDKKLVTNLYGQGDGLFINPEGKGLQWIVPAIKSVKDIKKYEELFRWASGSFSLPKLKYEFEFGLIEGIFNSVRRAKKESDLFVIGLLSSCFDSLAFLSGGFEKFASLIHGHPREIKKLITAAASFWARVGQELIKFGADGILIADDLAAERPFLEPNILREFFFTPMSNQVKKLKEMEAPVIFHSDGDIRDFVDDILGDKQINIKSPNGKKSTYHQLNVDALQCLQKPYFTLDDACRIKLKYPEKILWGNIDPNLDILAGGIEKSKRETEKLIQALKISARIAGREFVNDIVGESNVTLLSGDEGSRRMQIRALMSLYKVAEKSPDAEVGPVEKIPLMIGSIFYKGDALVTNPKTGEFDVDKARTQLRDLEKLSKRTGIKSALDVIAETPEAMERYIEFVARESKLPFLIDAGTIETRTTGVRKAQELHVIDRAIYNSITPHTTVEELEFLKNSEIDKAVLSVFNPDDFSIQGRLKTARELLRKVKNVGIKDVYIDVNIEDIGGLETSMEAVSLAGMKLGSACGFAPINALSILSANQKEALDPLLPDLFRLIAEESDFIFYAPISDAWRIYLALLLPSTPVSVAGILEKLKSPPISDEKLLAVIKKEGPLAHDLALAIINGDIGKTKELCKKALDKYCKIEEGKYRPHAKIDTIVKKVISPAILVVGQKFQRKEIYQRDMLRSCNAINQAMKFLEQWMKMTKKGRRYKVLIGLVYPNIQHLGKAMVCAMLRANGFEVHDIGNTVPPEEFVDRSKEIKPDVVGFSVFTNEALDNVEKSIKLLEEEGLREKVKVVIGGAAASSDVAREIGADGYAANAIEAVECIRELVI